MRSRRLLVVGASAGIGRAVAIAAMDAGAQVAGAARREPAGAVRITADVRRPDDCRRLVDDAVAGLGGLDALVYAAGIVPLSRLRAADASAWRAVLETNLVGAALVTQAALPALRERGGRVVYLSSDSVGRPREGLAPYVASKAALNELLAGWRVEEPEVTFIRAVVGPTLTDAASNWDPDLAAELFERWADVGFRYDDVMSPEDVARQIVDVLGAPEPIEEITVQPQRQP